MLALFKITTCLVHCFFLCQIIQRSNKKQVFCEWILKQFQFHNWDTLLPKRKCTLQTNKHCNRVKLSICLPMRLQNIEAWQKTNSEEKCWTILKRFFAVGAVEHWTTYKDYIWLSGEVKQVTQYALWFNGPHSARWWKKKKKEGGEEKILITWPRSHSESMLVGFCPQKYKSPSEWAVVSMQRASFSELLALSQSAASGW